MKRYRTNTMLANVNVIIGWINTLTISKSMQKKITLCPVMWQKSQNKILEKEFNT